MTAINIESSAEAASRELIHWAHMALQVDLALPSQDCAAPRSYSDATALADMQDKYGTIEQMTR